MKVQYPADVVDVITSIVVGILTIIDVVINDNPQVCCYLQVVDQSKN